MSVACACDASCACSGGMPSIFEERCWPQLSELRLATCWLLSSAVYCHSLPWHATAQSLSPPSSLAQARFLPALLRCRPTAAAQLAALCAGHWNALEAMAAAADATGGLVVLDQHQWAVLLRAYQRIAATCPYLATPAFFPPLRPL